MESASPLNQTSFLLSKGELIEAILAGIEIRKFNQAIAPVDNPALPGLTQYAMAQQTELALAMSLIGVPAHDNPILSNLSSDVQSGIQLNYRNLANVSEMVLTSPFNLLELVTNPYRQLKDVSLVLISPPLLFSLRTCCCGCRPWNYAYLLYFSDLLPKCNLEV